MKQFTQKHKHLLMLIMILVIVLFGVGYWYWYQHFRVPHGATSTVISTAILQQYCPAKIHVGSGTMQITESGGYDVTVLKNTAGIIGGYVVTPRGAVDTATRLIDGNEKVLAIAGGFSKDYAVQQARIDLFKAQYSVHTPLHCE